MSSVVNNGHSASAPDSAGEPRDFDVALVRIERVVGSFLPSDDRSTVVVPRQFIADVATLQREHATLREEMETWKWRHEQDTAGYAALVEVAGDVNVSLRLLPATGIDDAQRIYDTMYKILDRLARWLIDTPNYPGRPAPREVPARARAARAEP